MDYQAPGLGFTSAFNDSLMREAAERRQAMLDKINYEETQQKLRLGEETLEEKRIENRQKVRDQKENSVRKRIADMVPGDVPDSSLLADAKEVGVPLRTEPDLPKPIPQKFGTTSNETTGGIRFAGTPKQAEEKRKEDEVADIVDRMSSLAVTSPEFKKLAAEYEMKAGKPIPAAMLTDKSKEHIIFDPYSKQYYKAGDLLHPLKQSEIPSDAVIDRGAEHDNGPHSSGAENRIDRAYENAIKEVDTRIKPAQGHIDAINELGPMLNAMTPTSDALIAPLVIKATISGQGSGFRMTQGEINQVLGARSHWDSLAVALNAWKTDPSKALKLSDEQRADLHKLILGMRRKASKTIHDVSEARNAFDEAAQKGDENELRRERTKIIRLLDSLDPTEDDKDAGVVPNPKTPNARPAQHYDMSGNLITDKS